MSFQIQLTIDKPTENNSPQPQPFLKPLENSTKQKVEDLVEKLELTPHISQELKKQLQNWKFQTLNTYFEPLTTDDEKESAAEVLTMLFFDVLRPALLSIKTNEGLDELSIYKKQYKKVLLSLLPEGVEAKNFLAECNSAEMKTAEFILQTTLICQHLANIEAWFNKNCNGLNQKYYDHFENIQQELSRFVNRWEDETDVVADELKMMLKKLLTVQEQLTALDKDAIKIGEELMVERTNLDQMLAECSDLLAKGVK